MTLLKRILTATVLFAFFFVVFYLLICMVGGAISGAMAGGQDPQHAYELGARAGAEFVRHNLNMILLGSFVLSLASSLALSFSGILPWCRKTA